MPTRFDLTFEVGSYGRSASDDGWEEIEPQHIDVWKSAVDLLGRRTLRLPNGVINVVADWRPILRKHERHYATMKRFYAELSNDEAEFLSISKGFPTRKAKIPISVEVNGGNRLGKQHPNHLTAAAASSYLHDVFLILNLCAPGCCDFYRGTLVTTDAKTDVSLSNIDFEFALLGSFEKNWPSIKRLPLDRTVRWFDAVRPNAHQIPQNAMEKVLFALLHLATLDVDPMRVIWLFYALESLLETKAGENFSALVRRMGALLALDDQQSKILKTKFRALYDIRSAIVHGGFEVAHPMHNEILDERISENFRRWRDASDYGVTALIAAVQNTILRDWKYPNFAEEVYGIPLGEDDPP